MKYIKSPGDIFDLFKIFVYRFNEEQYIKRVLANDPKDFELKIQTLLNGSVVNDELCMFFTTIDNRSSFMAEQFIVGRDYDYKDPEFFSNMCDKLKTMDLFGEMLKYYIDDTANIDQHSLSVDYLYSMLRTKDIPEKIKFQLIHFNFNRSYYSDLLIDELREKYELIRKYYIKESKKIEEVNRLLQNEQTQINLCKAALLHPDECKDAYYSVSLLQEMLVSGFGNNKCTCIIIGSDTIQQLEKLDIPKEEIDVMLTSKAMADSLRINIINLIKEKGEMSTTDIAKAFDKGLTAMFYHLSMLYEAQILTARSEGRTVMYTINTGYMSRYTAYLNRFISEPSVKL